MKRAAALLLCLATQSIAQSSLRSVPATARVQTIDYAANVRFQVSISGAESVTLMLASGERIQSVEISDTAAYKLSFSDGADSMTLKATGSAVPVALNIFTDRRGYGIDLVPASPAAVPNIVRFHYGASASNEAGAADRLAISYRLKGDAALIPAAISDDGRKTYMQWGRYQAMPAVFAVGVSGKEEIVEGYMRDGVYTIDSISTRYVFRIDKQKATASRLDGGEGTK